MEEINMLVSELCATKSYWQLCFMMMCLANLLVELTISFLLFLVCYCDFSPFSYWCQIGF